MIAFIKGEVLELNPTSAIIMTGSGLGYLVNMSVFCSNKLEKNKNCELRITQIIKEDSHRLFGFLDKKEQNVFEMLLKVSGVGPVAALSVISNISVENFLKALSKGDDLALKKVPGIGPKTAKKIIVELEGRIKLSNQIEDSDKQKAYEALVGLGFKEDKVIKTLELIKEDKVENIIKEALKIINKG